MKTRKIDGTDLSANHFAFVGDPDDTSTWKLPIHFPGDQRKTVNHIKNALHRFDEVKSIPQSARRDVWHVIRGAALNLGIRVPYKEFQPETEVAVPAKPPVPAEPPVSVAKEQGESPRRASGELAALSDLRAEEFLKSLGLE